MRISSGEIDSVGSGQVGSLGTPSELQNSSAAAGAKSDSVSLSSAANLIALAKASGSFRQTKIDGLSAQVKSGVYQADNAQVSLAVIEGHITA